MNALYPDNTAPRFRLTRPFWWGIIILLVCCCPYLILMQLEKGGSIDAKSFPRARFILQLVAITAFLPCILGVLWGAVDSLLRHKKATRLHNNPTLAREEALRLAVDARQAPRFKLPCLYWIGLVIFFGVSLPAVFVMLASMLKLAGSDSDDSFDLLFAGSYLFMFSFHPGFICILGGFIAGLLQHHKKRKQFDATALTGAQG